MGRVELELVASRNLDASFYDIALNGLLLQVGESPLSVVLESRPFDIRSGNGMDIATRLTIYLRIIRFFVV